SRSCISPEEVRVPGTIASGLIILYDFWMSWVPSNFLAKPSSISQFSFSSLRHFLLWIDGVLFNSKPFASSEFFKFIIHINHLIKRSLLKQMTSIYLYIYLKSTQNSSNVPPEISNSLSPGARLMNLLFEYLNPFDEPSLTFIPSRLI